MSKTNELYELMCKAYNSAEDAEDLQPFNHYHTAEDWNTLIGCYIYEDFRPVDFPPICYGNLVRDGVLIRSEVKIAGRWQYKIIAEYFSQNS